MSAQPYRLTIKQKVGYVHAIVTGQNSAENMKDYLEELLRECTARGYCNVLIEERLVGPRLGMYDIFQLASTMGERARGAVEAVAYVDVNAETDRSTKFAEDVVVNRGLKARMSGSVEDAAEWLKPLRRRA